MPMSARSTVVLISLFSCAFSACSTVEERQNRALDAAHEAAGAANSAGEVIEENVNGFTAYVTDSVDWMQRMLAKLNYRARKLEEGIDKVQEARDALNEAIDPSDFGSPDELDAAENSREMNIERKDLD